MKKAKANSKTWIITGGAGFIGSHFARMILADNESRVIILDKLTYAGHLSTLSPVLKHRNFQFVKGDIGDRPLVSKLLKTHQPDAVINFAAETHVDRSIDGPLPFLETNVVGTVKFLEAIKNYWMLLDKKAKDSFRFLHVSTDEVYGSAPAGVLFKEESPYRPRSPYAASKASADHFVLSYYTTYGLPVLVTNTSNNFGPYQYPEKLIPLIILNGLEGKPLPVYGDGKNVRDWIYVEDHCRGINSVFDKGKLGEKYNIGASQEKTNIQIVKTICKLLEKHKPSHSNKNLLNKGIIKYEQLIQFVADRPGHDRRYAIKAQRVRQECHWKPQTKFDEAIEETILWYIQNRQWCEDVLTGQYQRQRLGLSV